MRTSQQHALFDILRSNTRRPKVFGVLPQSPQHHTFSFRRAKRLASRVSIDDRVSIMLLHQSDSNVLSIYRSKAGAANNR